MRSDSVGAPQDTTVRVAPDTIPPLVPLARFQPTLRDGWRRGVWSWDQQALLDEAALDLGDLLERVPGFTRVRTGVYGATEGASVLGLGGGRVEFVFDGYVLDPLDPSVQDLTRLELASLASVRVERFLDVFRVHVETLQPIENRPYSRIEAGTGDFDLEMFRGVFLAPSFLGGRLGLALERLAARQVDLAEQASTFNGWVKWSAVSARGHQGLTFEMRRTSIDRDEDFPAPLDGKRNDVILRARRLLSRGFLAEAFVGRSTQNDVYADLRPVPDSLKQPRRVTKEVLQGGVRTQLMRDAVWSEGSVRLRTDDVLPEMSGDFALGLRAIPRVELAGRALFESWSVGGSATSLSARGSVDLVAGLSAFGEWASGLRGVPMFVQSGDAARFTDRTATRLGGEFGLGALTLGGAVLTAEMDSVATFGLDFDRSDSLAAGARLDGFELAGRLPIFTRKLVAEGWYTEWSGDTFPIYVSARSWRGALAYHDKPLRRNPNFEVWSRVEAHRRGSMAVPTIAEDEETQLTVVPSRTEYNFYLQIRVVDVRAFLRWENVAHTLDQYDVPERPLPGQRIFFGIKWEFWN